jgi:hypothetical protein
MAASLDITGELDIIGEVGSLSAGDVLDLRSNFQAGTNTLASQDDLQRITARHHRAAQLLAQGHPKTVVARVLRSSEAGLNRLIGCPAFAELVESYQKEIFQEEVVFTQDLLGLRDEVMDALREKVESRSVKAETLVAATRDLLDRTGYSPVKRLQVVSTNLGPQDLEEMKNRAQAREGENVVKARPGGPPVGETPPGLPAGGEPAKPGSEGSGEGV